MLNKPKPQHLIQVAIRYEATLANIASISMTPTRARIQAPKVQTLLALGAVSPPPIEEDALVCPICHTVTPAQQINGHGPQHVSACPVLLAQRTLTLPD